MALTFDRTLDAPYGAQIRLSPLVSRVLAPNPGPFTFRGTGVYLVGRDALAVIDPGPDMPEHLAALKQAIGTRTVSHILVTHNHRDHSPAARPLAAWSGAKIYAAASAGQPSSRAPASEDRRGEVEEGFDHDFRPDMMVRDGDVIAGEGFTLQAVFTPGHTAHHMCYALAEEQALFCGDHVMGWSTSVVAPPDGDMAAYMASLEKLVARGDRILYPTHGSPIAAPHAYLVAYLAHRQEREAQILAALTEPASITTLVARLYAGLDSRLQAAAAQTVRAHLLKLQAERRAAMTDGVWRRL